VAKVSFTGSRETGALVSTAAAPSFKKVTMELGELLVLLSCAGIFFFGPRMVLIHTRLLI
jgi:hypothetical protein